MALFARLRSVLHGLAERNASRTPKNQSRPVAEELERRELLSGTAGVFDPKTATWYLRNSNTAGGPDAGQFRYGSPGMVPVAGDWDGNGSSTPGVFDPKTATWYLRDSNSA